MVLGVVGNYYVLGADIKDVRAKMTAGFEKVDKRFEKLEARQTETQRQALSVVHGMLKNCSAKK